jgi:hypothetical protein
MNDTTEPLGEQFSIKEKYQNPTRIQIHSDREMFAFLLGDAIIDPNILTQDLANEVNLVATLSNRTKEERGKEAERLRTTVGQKAREDAVKHGLSDEDTIALEQLYAGFTQADLIESGKPYEVKITLGENTGYALNTPQQSSEKLQASRALYEVLLSEFDSIGLWDKGIQVRRSKNPLFRRTAMQGLAIISTLEKDPFEFKVTVLRAVPINGVKNAIIGFETFRRSVDNMRNVLN